MIEVNWADLILLCFLVYCFGNIRGFLQVQEESSKFWRFVTDPEMLPAGVAAILQARMVMHVETNYVNANRVKRWIHRRIERKIEKKAEKEKGVIGD